VLWLDAASFFISAGIIWTLVPRFKPGHELAADESKPTHYLEELKEGLRFIMQDGLILSIVVMVMLLNFLDAIFGGVV
jgi:hypothetical protein